MSNVILEKHISLANSVAMKDKNKIYELKCTTTAYCAGPKLKQKVISC